MPSSGLFFPFLAQPGGGGPAPGVGSITVADAITTANVATVNIPGAAKTVSVADSVTTGNTATLAPLSSARTVSVADTITTANVPSVIVPIRVNATPTGPTGVTWVTQMADGFSLAGPAIGAAGSFFGPNRDNRTAPYRPGFNSNEVAIFDTGLVSLGAAGLLLGAVNDPGIGATVDAANPGVGFQTAANYRSGCVWSAPTNAQGGAPGWPTIAGFQYSPGSATGKTCIEVVCTVPFVSGTMQGSDMAIWGSDGPGTVEWDGPELAQVINPNTSLGGSSIWNIINHNTGGQNPLQAFNPSYMTDGAQHRFTTVIDSNAETIDGWVDGTHVSGGPFAWPSGTLPTNYTGIYLSYSFRDNGNGQSPSFTGSVTTSVRSILVAQDSAHAGVGIIGGGVQTGTVMV